MENEKRLIEIPADGVISIQIMFGDTTVGEKRIDLSHYPTVDAVEVKHGRWISVDDSLFPGTKEKCSLCGVHKGIGYVYHYCPNCGAKMDLNNE